MAADLLKRVHDGNKKSTSVVALRRPDDVEYDFLYLHRDEQDKAVRDLRTDPEEETAGQLERVLGRVPILRNIL
jgi:hypothetical protein